jgi:hypothetical protein
VSALPAQLAALLQPHPKQQEAGQWQELQAMGQDLLL